MKCSGSQKGATQAHPFFIAVHVGVGQHSVQREKAYRSVLRDACRLGAQELESSGDPLKAVIAAVSSLEDAPLGNAGLNSNLTVKGVVLCDASAMLGDGAFGAVGAVSGITNPVSVAGELARQSREPMALQRVRPMFLAGDGAREWALEQGLTAAPSAEAAIQWHITEAAQRRWQRYKRMIDEATQSQENPAKAASANSVGPNLESGEPTTSFPEDAKPPSKRLRTDTSGGATEHLPSSDPFEEDGGCLAYDTVGAVCVDALGRVAAGVSSGGIAMKTDGRVGEAAIFGCGCWAADADPQAGRPAVACSVTGVGEAIMRAGLSRACAEALAANAAAPGAVAPASTLDAVCAREIRSRVELGQPAGLPCPQRACGVIAVRVGRSSAAPEGADGTSCGPSCGAGGANCGTPGVPPGSQDIRHCGIATADAANAGGCSSDGPDQTVNKRVERDGSKVVLPEGPVQYVEDGIDRAAGKSRTWDAPGPIEDCQRQGREHDVMHVEFGAVHNSASMGVGYWATGMESPKCSILRREGLATESTAADMCFIGAQQSWLLGDQQV